MLMKNMKTNPLRFIFFLTLFIALLAAGLSQPLRHVTAQQGLASATPTYDPFVETPLPPNPTELELGQNRYWHWCMPCHGDKGQGLTDEFRSYWVSDHQNCWARGCHNVHGDHMGFPIPTLVPGIVKGNHLAQFATLQEFADFLKATHPPQSPGVLEDEEYHAIAFFVFTMNGRITDSAPAPVFTPTETLIPPQATATATPYFAPINVIVTLAVLMVVVLIIRRRGQTEE